MRPTRSYAIFPCFPSNTLLSSRSPPRSTFPSESTLLYGKMGLSASQKALFLRHPVSQNTIRNDIVPLALLLHEGSESLEAWVAHYFRLAVTTSLASQKVQHRDFALFLRYMQTEEGHTRCMAWTPRLTRDFQRHLQGTRTERGQRYWSDKTMVRVMAHLKTLATWMHSLQPFPLGHPMAKIKLPAVGSSLQIERALTPSERRRLLDAADQ